MNEVIETIGYRGLNIKIYQDFDPIDPTAEWDMLGTMACWHSRYNLGHDQPVDDPDEWAIELANQADPTVEDRIYHWNEGKGWESLNNKYPLYSEHGEKAIEISNKMIHSLVWKTLEKHYVMLPLYLYDHSGITMNTSGFSCQWDSGQVGWFYASKKEIKKEFNWILLTKKRIKKVIDILNSEVKAYDDYLTGNVYGYIVEDQMGNHIDSCWGFFGYDHAKSGLLEYSQNAADCHLERERIECMKAYQKEWGDISQLAYC
jgi:hypothetical protein